MMGEEQQACRGDSLQKNVQLAKLRTMIFVNGVWRNKTSHHLQGSRGDEGLVIFGALALLVRSHGVA